MNVSKVFLLDLENIAQNQLHLVCLNPHIHRFSFPLSRFLHPSLHWLPCPIPTPSCMTCRNTRGLSPLWAGLLIIVNCLGWSCGLTLSKAIWCWDKTGEKRHSQDLQDLWLTKAVSLMRKEEIKGVLAFWQKPQLNTGMPRGKSNSTYNKLIKLPIDSSFVVNTVDWSHFSTSRT